MSREDRIAAIKRLIARPGTPGEKAAAEAALKRLLNTKEPEKPKSPFADANPRFMGWDISSEATNFYGSTYWKTFQEQVMESILGKLEEELLKQQTQKQTYKGPSYEIEVTLRAEVKRDGTIYNTFRVLKFQNMPSDEAEAKAIEAMCNMYNCTIKDVTVIGVEIRIKER